MCGVVYVWSMSLASFDLASSPSRGDVLPVDDRNAVGILVEFRSRFSVFVKTASFPIDQKDVFCMWVNADG